MITQVLVVRRGAALSAFAAALMFAPAVFAQTSENGTASAAEAEVAAEVEQITVAPLSAEQEALRAALTRRLGADSPALAAYEERRFEPIWLDADGAANARANALVAALAKAGSHALPEERYDAAGLAGRLAAGGPEVEAELAHAYLAYASDLSSGVLEPRRVDGELNVFPERPDPARLITEAAAAPDFAAYIRSLEPAHPDYARLVERYAVFRSRAAGAIWGEPIRNGRTLRPGDRHSRVAEVRARLVAMGDLDPKAYTATTSINDGEKVAANDVTTDATEPALDETLFDDILVQAVKHFQLRHGLNDDGVVGPATLRQLNISPANRAEQIAVNLERLRWLNRDLGERHILVNLAGFSMAVINKGREEFKSRVVVGKAGRHRTPEFSEMMTHMIVNPSWHVPRSIATQEILPILKKDPTYLARKGMRVVGGEEPLDWTEVTPGTFPGRIVQRPGAGNALGTVKFMFPNRFSIYLHDTPSKRLFGRDVRAFSHGCVRVEKPEEFAAYLLTGQTEDPLGYFRSLRGRGGERRVNLDNPLPVHLTYRTAWVDTDGTFEFRGDIYGRDARVADALVRTGVTILQ